MITNIDTPFEKIPTTGMGSLNIYYGGRVS